MNNSHLKNREKTGMRNRKLSFPSFSPKLTAMRLLPSFILNLAFGVFISFAASAQDSASIEENTNQVGMSGAVSTRFLKGATNRVIKLNKKLERESIKSLKTYQRLEGELFQLLSSTDSLEAIRLLKGSKNYFDQLTRQLENPAQIAKYVPEWDTLFTAVKFVSGDKISKFHELANAFNKAELIRKYLIDRESFFKTYFRNKTGIKALKQLNKDVYYYNQQVKSYSLLLKDRTRIERKGLELIKRSKAFNAFMKKNSMIASLFPDIPYAETSADSSKNINGLQTKYHLQKHLATSLGLSENIIGNKIEPLIDDAQGQLDGLKLQVLQGVIQEVSEIVPDFKPNKQKSMITRQRIEYGINFQSARVTMYFPAILDLGGSVGYRLNDKSLIGVGFSYKVGLGTSWQNINITHQGFGIRSFLDWHLKGSFHVSGGFELNYRNQYARLYQLKKVSNWNQSGLVGIKKVVSLKSKFFKKTNVQLLYDFLNQIQRPVGQPLIFRVGYSF